MTRKGNNHNKILYSIKKRRKEKRIITRGGKTEKPKKKKTRQDIPFAMKTNPKKRDKIKHNHANRDFAL